MTDFGVVMMAKLPRPGSVKTRLCPPFTLQEAAEMAAAALTDSVRAMRASAASSRLIALDDGGHGRDRDLEKSWGMTVVSQRGGDLGERLDNALAQAWSRNSVPQLVIGMDTPQITAELLADVAQTVRSPNEVVLGRAVDGGFWCLGFGGRPHPALKGIAMSRSDTAERVEAELHRLGLVVKAAPVLEDVDDAASAARVADVAPHTHFARRYRALIAPNP